jgi:hypothetical protein
MITYLKLENVATWLSPGKVHFGFVLTDGKANKYGFEVTSKGCYESAMSKTIRRMDPAPIPENPGHVEQAIPAAERAAEVADVSGDEVPVEAAD